MYPQSVTWCRFSAERIIEPYFHENEVGEIETVTGKHYRNMITNFLGHALENINFNMFFQLQEQCLIF